MNTEYIAELIHTSYDNNYTDEKIRLKPFPLDVQQTSSKGWGLTKFKAMCLVCADSEGAKPRPYESSHTIKAAKLNK